VAQINAKLQTRITKARMDKEKSSSWNADTQAAKEQFMDWLWNALVELGSALDARIVESETLEGMSNSTTLELYAFRECVLEAQAMEDFDQCTEAATFFVGALPNLASLTLTDKAFHISNFQKAIQRLMQDMQYIRQRVYQASDETLRTNPMWVTNAKGKTMTRQDKAQQQRYNTRAYRMNDGGKVVLDEQTGNRTKRTSTWASTTYDEKKNQPAAGLFLQQRDSSSEVPVSDPLTLSCASVRTQRTLINTTIPFQYCSTTEGKEWVRRFLKHYRDEVKCLPSCRSSSPEDVMGFNNSEQHCSVLWKCLVESITPVDTANCLQQWKQHISHADCNCARKHFKNVCLTTLQLKTETNDGVVFSAKDWAQPCACVVRKLIAHSKLVEACCEYPMSPADMANPTGRGIMSVDSLLLSMPIDIQNQIMAYSLNPAGENIPQALCVCKSLKQVVKNATALHLAIPTSHMYTLLQANYSIKSTLTDKLNIRYSTLRTPKSGSKLICHSDDGMAGRYLAVVRHVFATVSHQYTERVWCSPHLAQKEAPPLPHAPAEPEDEYVPYCCHFRESIRSLPDDTRTMDGNLSFEISCAKGPSLLLLLEQEVISKPIDKHTPPAPANSYRIGHTRLTQPHHTPHIILALISDDQRLRVLDTYKSLQEAFAKISFPTKDLADKDAMDTDEPQLINFNTLATTRIGRTVRLVHGVWDRIRCPCSTRDEWHVSKDKNHAVVHRTRPDQSSYLITGGKVQWM
jgi:hypothetical protein